MLNTLYNKYNYNTNVWCIYLYISKYNCKCNTIYESTIYRIYVYDIEGVTGRNDRGLWIEEIGCTCQTFFISLLSSSRRQSSDVFFFPSLYKFKKRFLLKYCVARVTPGSTWTLLLSNLELTHAFLLGKCLSSAMLMYSAFTPDSVFRSVLPKGSELKKQIYYTQILFS